MSRNEIFAGLAIFFATFLIATLIIFAFFEANPMMSSRVFSDEIHYYALRRRFIEDPDLVFHWRPRAYHVKDGLGDLYRPGLHVKPAPFPFELVVGPDGFRNENPSRSDIVLLGDSFLGVSESLEDSLRFRIKKATGLQTSDFGTEWWGPCQYLRVFERYGLKQLPRYAVMCFFEGNDLEDVVQYQRWKAGGNYYHFNLSSKSFFKRYLIASRDVWRYFKKRILGILGIKNRYEADVRDELVEVKIGDRTFPTVFSYKSDTRTVKDILNSNEGKILDQVFKEWTKTCHDYHIKPLIAYFPSTVHIYGPYSTGHSGAKWLKIRTQQLQAAENQETAIRELAGRSAISFLSFTPFFKDAARNRQYLYYQFDTHLNPMGRELAAGKIAEQIKKL